MYRSITASIQSLVIAFAVVTASTTFAQVIEFDFVGNGGVGLLPGNEVGANTATAATSNAFGSETANSLLFDTATNTLSFDFAFQDLTEGLEFQAGSGIHFHLPSVSGDPFNQTGPIVFNLNSFSDPAVTNTNTQIMDGTPSGSVTGTVSFANNLDLVDDLLAGEFYLNIHSESFGGGELRGSVTPSAIPEPGSITAVALAFAGLFARRRRTA